MLTGVISVARAEYSLKVASSSVSVHISGDLDQGVASQLPNSTARPIGTIPQFNGHLAGDNTTQLAGLLTSSIKQKTSNAEVSLSSFSANSNGTSLHYDMEFEVDNISSSNGYGENVDLAWRSFVVASDFGIGSFSINRVFHFYLEKSLLSLVQSTIPGPVQVVTSLVVNDKRIAISDASSHTDNLRIFNFSSLDTPLRSWETIRRPLPSNIILESLAGFNVTYLETITESGERANVDFNAVYSVNATIEAPFTSIISDDKLFLESGGAALANWVMLSVVTASLVVFVSAFLIEKRLLKTLSRSRRQRS